MLDKLAAETPDQLVRVLYYSKAVLDVAPDRFAEECARILAVARRFNPRVGITGALMVSDRRFTQVLEGSAAAVNELFQRICQDPRHRYVTLLWTKPVERRMFGAWAMGLASSKPGVFVDAIPHATVDRAIAEPAQASDELIAAMLGLVQTSETPVVG